MTDSKTFRIIRIVTASDMTPEKADMVAQKFSEHFHISDYSVIQETEKELIGGFVIYAAGYRYDYSVKGQLARIAKQLKTTRAISTNLDGLEPSEKESDLIKKSIDMALSAFDEQPMALQGQDLLWEGEGAGIVAPETDTPRRLVDQLREQMANSFMESTTVEEIGQVMSISDGVAWVKGIEHCMSSELIMFTSTTYGIAMNLEKDKVGIVLLGESGDVVEGTMCKRTGKTVSVPVGSDLLGRVIDPLGTPIDGKGVLHTTSFRAIESVAPGIVDRSPVNESLQTGITAIDAMTPIGKGQRELIIGDRQTGKTAIVIDTILNQKGKNVICVYVAIGQKMSTIVQIVNTLEKYNALSYTVIVAASASQTASLQYIAPYAGCAIAEEFMYNNHEDVLIVYDDLTKHAQAYRAISLLLRRPPGREAYPGDVFYLHSRLLERAAKLDITKGGGSMTALPIIETQGGDISAYIPTNVISITDGQIYLESELFFSGQRPAINVGLSVSRVGGDAQTKAMKKVAGPLRINLAQAREMASFAQFGSDLDENTQMQLKRGIVLNEILKQPQYSPVPMEEQVVILYLANNDRLTFLDKEDVSEYAESFMQNMRILHPDVLLDIATSKEYTPGIQEKIDGFEKQFHSSYLIEHPEYTKTE
ncbi:MAG: F0F1 ATP synthase subunit alpha [Eubacteriales bacterium]